MISQFLWLTLWVDAGDDHFASKEMESLEKVNLRGNVRQCPFMQHIFCVTSWQNSTIWNCGAFSLLPHAMGTLQTITLTHWHIQGDNTQEFDKVWGPSTWVLSTKRQLGAALKISDSSLKTFHPWAEASVVVRTGARPLDRDCFSSQNLTCVCSDWSQCFPWIYLLAMPKLRFYTEWTLLFL